MYPSSIKQKKELLSETLKPSFSPHISRQSKRMHHKSVDSAIKTDDMALKLQEHTEKMQQSREYENDAVIDEEEEKDGSDIEDFERE